MLILINNVIKNTNYFVLFPYKIYYIYKIVFLPMIFLKHIILTFLLCELYFSSFAQGIINNGGFIYVGSSNFVIINSCDYKNLTNVTDGSMALSGTIEMTGACNWLNNATGSLDLSANSGTVKFLGSTAQIIGGTTAANPSTIFKNLTIENSAGVSLANHISVTLALTMTTGNFDLKNNNIDLSTTGSITGETNSNRMLVSTGDGQIKATRDIAAGANANIAGLRISIDGGTYAGLSKTIYRGHKVLSGTGGYAANLSAALYYILPNNPQFGANPAITINYFDAEFATNLTASESNLQIFQQIQQGGTPWFTPLGSTVVTGANKITNTATPYDTYVTDRPGLITFNGLVTIGSTDKPLPISLVDFKSICNENTIHLIWQTGSEINNDYFTIEKSVDASIFEPIGTVKGAGNSNEMQSYSFIDERSDLTDILTYYYRLKQTDFNGNFTYSNTISANCNEQHQPSTFFDLSVADEQDINKLLISFKSQTGTKYNVMIFDQLGRKMYFKNLTASEDNEKISISKQGFATGIYNLVIYNNTLSVNKKIVLINK